MNYEEMVAELQRRLGPGVARPDTVLAATVQALGESAWNVAAELRAHLPRQLGEVRPAGPGEPLSLDAFLDRIGQLSGAQDFEQAREYGRAGVGVISEALPPEQLRRLLHELPEDYATLLPSDSGLSATADALLAEVRRHASLADEEQARELTRAVLGVTSSAVSRGEAARLTGALPPEIGALPDTREFAQHTDTDRFLAEITRHSGVTTPNLVREHTRAVFDVLGRWAPEELADTLDQLPEPVAALPREPGGSATRQ
ncbi:DUF2267 domain-containing protein [Actinopolyspora erythraea]|uniref:DUF2267 domain-containing protein n=1 Tax=Actinopolyspora erythraea TaxID=414996 RepID=A0A099D8E3_9ACTN|nr:DUF2267 domain-containing protein [Actinopolyspora erythraea]ASU80068.1 DUF2267 domain-containing protein [Actinopolyspora erythraea]KGI82201.1 hypothetical protein IL38_05490 [Actinopolyspora erythraea]